MVKRVLGYEAVAAWLPSFEGVMMGRLLGSGLVLLAFGLVYGCSVTMGPCFDGRKKHRAPVRMSLAHDVFMFIGYRSTVIVVFNLILSDAGPIMSVKSPGSTTRLSCWSTMLRTRSEEHTSELQSRQYLVCRLLLEK